MHHGHISKMLAGIMGLLVIAIIAAGVGMARAEIITVSENLCVNIQADLTKGMRNAAVSDLQKFLASEGLVQTKHITSYFGPITEAALKRYQMSRQISQTGKADVITRASIQFFSCGNSSVDIPNYVPMIRGLFGPGIAKAGATAMIALIVNNEFSSSFTTTINWGDGSTSEPQTINAKASHAQIFTHTYTTPGRYDVVSTVTNPSGKKNASTITVTVE